MKGCGIGVSLGHLDARTYLSGRPQQVGCFMSGMRLLLLFLSFGV